MAFNKNTGMGAKVALGILQPKGKTVEDLKKARNIMIFKWHPDRAGNTAQTLSMAQAINAAFQTLYEDIGNWHLSWGPNAEESTGDNHFFAEMVAIVNKINHLPEIIIERRGVWLWVFGDTQPIKKYLSAAGLTWASKSQEWYWRPDWSASKKRWGKKVLTRDEKRRSFGYSQFDKREATALG